MIIKSFAQASGAQRTEGSCAPRPEQDERGPPKAITAGKFFTAEIGWTPFQLSRKILARLINVVVTHNY